MVSRCFKFVSDHPEADEENAKIKFTADGIQVALAAARRVAVDGFRAERETELDIGAYLACMQTPVEPSHLDSVSVKYVVII